MLQFVGTAIAIILGILILGVVGLLLGLPLYAYLWLAKGGWRMRKALEKKGRTISLKEAVVKFRGKEGILIVEAPSLGWPVSRLWWSADVEFRMRTPKTMDGEFCSPEDFFNYDKFIDPSTGCAELITAFIFSSRVRNYLQTHFSTDEFFYIYSGGVLATRHLGETSRGNQISPKIE